MDKWIVCLKHGDKYDSHYVNVLYNMTERHMNTKHGFACITENPTGLNNNIEVLPLPKAKLSGWWYKPYLFSKDFPLNGDLLFFDLDLVIIKNIDSLWNYEPDKFCIIQDFNRTYIPNYHKMNSSVFRLHKGQFPHVWDNLTADWKQTSKMHGDQDWIYNQMFQNPKYMFWPDKWIRSYKWEIRDKNDVVRNPNNKRVFREKTNPYIDPETSILVFHGEPKPIDVEDTVIVDNWN